jgi:hypothetical protein
LPGLAGTPGRLVVVTAGVGSAADAAPEASINTPNTGRITVVEMRIGNSI